MRDRFAAVYRMEMRLICLHWSYWVLLALFSLWTISSYTSRQYESAESILLFDFLIGVTSTGSLAIMVIAAISFSRAQRNRALALEESFPTGGEILLGRWSAVMTALGIFLLVPIAIALVAGPFSEFISSLPVYLLETLLVLGISAALVAIISITIGIKRWVYPFFALVWLGSALIPAMLNTKLFPWSLLLSFTANGWSGFNYSMVWGRLAEGNLPAMVRLTYIGALALLMSLVLWKITRERMHRFSLSLTVTAILSLAVVLIGAAGYSADIQVVDARDADSMNFMSDKDMNYFSIPADMPYAPTDYALTLDLSSFDTPTFSLHMDILNRGDEPLNDMAFALNHQLEITEASLPFEQEWDYMRLLPEQPLAPGDTLTVDMTYQGALWWFDGGIQGRPPEAEDFIKPDGINLNCMAAWYPIPGNIHLGMLGGYPDRLTPDCYLSQPAAFSLQVAYTGNLHFASNLQSSDEQTFASPGATWVQLMASPRLVSQKLDALTLTTIQSQFDAGQAVAQDAYLPAFQQIQQFFPDIEHINVFMVDSGFGDNFFGGFAAPASSDALTVVVNPAYVFAFPRSPSNQFTFTYSKMTASLLGQGDTRLADNIAYFLRAYHEAQGDSAQIQTLMKAGIPMGEAAFQIFYSTSEDERYSIAYALNDIYNQQGQAVLQTLLQNIRANASTLSSQSNEAIIAWIKENVHA